jgi:hypothetical protein
MEIMNNFSGYAGFGVDAVAWRDRRGKEDRERVKGKGKPRKFWSVVGPFVKAWRAGERQA